jgi:hypothetical protein
LFVATVQSSPALNTLKKNEKHLERHGNAWLILEADCVLLAASETKMQLRKGGPPMREKEVVTAEQVAGSGVALSPGGLRLQDRSTLFCVAFAQSPYIQQLGGG